MKASVGEGQANLSAAKPAPRWDAALLLAVMWNQWNTVFRKTLGRAERTLVSELRDVRNKWAHQTPFSGDDTDRALDSDRTIADGRLRRRRRTKSTKMKIELRRLIFDEQMRSEKRKSAGTAIESAGDRQR